MSELENRYSALFGTKTSKGQLTGGFLLLSAGALLGLAALVLFFISLAQPGADQISWRRVALPLGTVAMPLIFLGITVALPTRTSMRVTSYVGLVCALTAAGLFLLHYPDHIFVSRFAKPGVTAPADFAWMDVGLYAIGLVFMFASIITSIVGYYLTRLGPAAGEGKAEDEDEYGPGYEVPDWVVERDIEEAMKKHGVSWGEGIRDAHKNTLYVNVADSMGSGDLVVGGLGKARTVQVESTQVDEATAKLSGTRGHKKGAIPGEWADESVAALVAFRRQKAANPTLYAPKRTFWQKVGDFFTGRGRRVAAPRPAPAAAPKAPPVSMPKRGTTVVIHDDEPAPEAHKTARKGHK